MEPALKSIQRTSRNIFIGSFLLVGFFIIAVKFNVFQSRLMEGEPLPEIKSGQWLTAPLSMDDTEGKVILLFFVKGDVEISREMLSWSYKLQKKHHASGLITLAIEVPASDEQRKKYGSINFSDTPDGFYAFADTDNTERKKYRHASYATFYVADRLGTIRAVRDAAKGFDAMELAVAGLLK